MPDRDAQTVALSRQSILVVTGVAVGLLTLVFVLGVQVGKQTAALRAPRPATGGEALTELPASLAEQLKPFENANGTPRQEDPRPSGKPADEKPLAKPESKAEAERWTLQLLSTTDEGEAKRMADKAKGAGVATATLKDKGQYKVRVAKPGSKSDMDALAKKLKAKGLDSFAVRVE